MKSEHKLGALLGSLAIIGFSVVISIGFLNQPEGMGINERRAYTEYLDACEKMDGMPEPPSIMKEGLESD